MSTLNVDTLSPVTPGGPVNITGAPPTFLGTTSGFGYAQIKPISGTSYTIDPTDVGKVLRTTSASPVTIIANSGLPTWGIIGIRQAGAGTVSVTAGSGVTITSPASLNSSGPNSSLALHIVSSTVYDLTGDLA